MEVRKIAAAPARHDFEISEQFIWDMQTSVADRQAPAR
jgi:hypothetical protein